MENVYIVETYKECYKNKDGTYKLKNTVITDDNIEILYKDHGYHYEIDPNKDCCVFGDIDKCLNKRLLFKLLSKIQKLYDVSDDEFIHTLGKKKKSENITMVHIGLYRQLKQIQNQLNYI